MAQTQTSEVLTNNKAPTPVQRQKDEKYNVLVTVKYDAFKSHLNDQILDLTSHETAHNNVSYQQNTLGFLLAAIFQMAS